MAEQIIHLKNRHGRVVSVNADQAERLLETGRYSRSEPPPEPAEADKKTPEKKTR